MPEKDISSIFTNNLKKLLSENNMTYKELSEKLGVKASSVSMWMSGNSLPRMGMLDKLADLFNVSVEYLITNKEIKQGYYLNEETAKLAQEMYEDKDMRSLFDMKRNMPPERFKTHMDFMKNLYNQEKNAGELSKIKQEIIEPLEFINNVNAAHPIPGASEEDKQHDEDIMNDEDF